MPVPFSRAIFHYGQPFSIPRELSEAQREQWRLELENRLKAVGTQAEEQFEELWDQV